MQTILEVGYIFDLRNGAIAPENSPSPPRKCNNFGTLPVTGYAFKLSLVESHV